MAAEPALGCVCLSGPTACGKTELALGLAERLPLEIVSMDSAMVYRGLDIGTAKPSALARARVPHHLVDIIEPTETYSAGRFARDALAAIREIGARGRLPLLVGGTLLYLRALREGLASLPRADAVVRAELDAEGRALGWPALHERLERLDPEAAARIAPTDRQRIQRALEVHALTGLPLTELQRRGPAAPKLTIATIALVPEDRAVLAQRIER
ncbi:MAG TPA: tRNA (adenosine(37)-N6)-dimethylallyltransferase MiaA, partial [Gammaproteobacteria bacterium]|nr:tRNA (adenosine(37)-N6)-dimethylallyltransferase MiaA [Gammaproteobacteria bacterium]